MKYNAEEARNLKLYGELPDSGWWMVLVLSVTEYFYPFIVFEQSLATFTDYSRDWLGLFSDCFYLAVAMEDFSFLHLPFSSGMK